MLYSCDHLCLSKLIPTSLSWSRSSWLTELWLNSQIHPSRVKWIKQLQKHWWKERNPITSELKTTNIRAKETMKTHTEKSHSNGASGSSIFKPVYQLCNLEHQDCRYMMWVPRQCRSRMCEDVRHLSHGYTTFTSHMRFLNANVNVTD